MKISFGAVNFGKGDTLIAGVYEGGALTPAAKKLDEKTHGAVKKALKSGKFSGKTEQVLSLVAPAGLTYNRLLLTGLGKEKELTAQKAENIGGRLAQTLNSLGVKDAAFAVDFAGKKLTESETAAHVAVGAKLGAYRFDKYRTKQKDDDKPSLTAFILMTKDHAAAGAAYKPLEKVADGVLLTRDLVSEPANVIYPATLAKECEKLKSLGVEVQVMGETHLKKLGMGALLGVGQGSERESHVVVMQWKGNPKDKKAPLAFLGKGVTFDTGGISIKPAGGMEEMKFDMGGAAAVIGLMKALAGRKAKVNVVGVVGLVENMPSGAAQRPGDVVTSMSGQTIEVINTDAEGRLVLADILWYTKETFKPRFMINLATLTGAIIVSLGSMRAGLFSNDDTLAQHIFDSGLAVAEPVWRLPLGDEYDRMINSDIADMQNIGRDREAGSITAAQFLKRFVGDVPWAHLDIAGTAWSKKGSSLAPKGGTGFGVRLLNRLVAEYYEK